MRVVTWNMNYWEQHAFHDDAWRWLVDELRPDVALVQECVPPAWLRDTHSVVFDRAYPVGDQSWGSALVTRGLRAREVRLDALEDWFAKLPPGDAWSLQRLAGWGACAEVELVGGATLLVVSIHSSHRAIEPARLAGVDVEPVKLKLANGVWMLDVLFHFLKARLDRPLLVGGDFNYSRLLDDPKPRGNGEFFDRV